MNLSLVLELEWIPVCHLHRIYLPKGLSVLRSQCTIVVVFLPRFPLTDIRLCSSIGLTLTQAAVLRIVYHSDIWIPVNRSHDMVHLFIHTNSHETLICLKNMLALSHLPFIESLLGMNLYVVHLSWVWEATLHGLCFTTRMVVIIWPSDMLKEKQFCVRFNAFSMYSFAKWSVQWVDLVQVFHSGSISSW